VTAAEHALGGRLALFDPDAVTTTQRELFDRITATAAPWAQHSGFAATTAGGRLIGPFNPSLLSPAIATEFLKLQAAEEQYTSLDERQRQVVILTVGGCGRHPTSSMRTLRSLGMPAWPSRSLPNWSPAVYLRPSPMPRKRPTGSPGRCPPPITSMTTCTAKPSKHSAPQVFSRSPP
jgi:hypothetical protein